MGSARPDWAEMLAAACRGEGISTLYQPIVDTARGSVVGYEALTRFSGYSERNPETWFRAARTHGMAEDLEVMALRTALRARPTMPTNCFLTVNVSPDLLPRESERSVWRDEGDLGGLIVELTEQAPIESYLALEPDLDLLRSAGALIAVDDAGAGYAGLRHLLSLRPSLIKLDRAIVQDVDRDEAKRALVEMLGTFAGRVDAWLLAEGVERLEELDTLVALGIPLVQGYCLARPAPAWVGIDEDVAIRLATRVVPGKTRVIRDFLEIVPTATSVSDASAAFVSDPKLRAVVLLDEHSRPLAVLEADASHLGVVSPGLRVNLETPVTDALGRAMTRDPGVRFEPLLATDNAGRFTGIVRLERLITVLAAEGR
ncbi:EAL domain, c-di-GMP-specific phosphodiesterase class I (or its enzymatically inactive variant) [Cryobacterium psychrotolerans]|uniref:EAL domain, c-di-GMP-specific phosphodiesterase class I (Or its enzymatically inactive variant) n=1 Tax=Cryobacterium psychrotolerans TaxID=386301 RepID=A0A1G8Y4A3_9MICO|nr:EAL domain, c-di-GMP-specific phosphodiesterase class I (or its enzymatically inactive variant) [Cryobacterium psychrotolerans]